MHERFKFPPGEDQHPTSAVIEKAILIINVVQNELRFGTKYYDKDNPKEVITDPREIIGLMASGRLEIEPTKKRRHLFDKYKDKKTYVKNLLDGGGITKTK